jgi:hypothetical protein
VSSEQNDTTFHIKDLSDSTDYYWKVVARDNFGATGESPVWSFSVSSDKPDNNDKTGLLAYYPFNGDASDQSSHHLDGYVSGASLTNDRKSNANSAMRFDGYSSYITVPYAPLLDLGETFTLALWLKPDYGYGQNHQGHIYLLSRWEATGYLASSYLLALTPNGKVYFSTYNDVIHEIQGYTTVPVNNWSHIAVTRSISGEVKLFVNGELDNSGYIPMQQSSSYDLEIGRHRIGYSYFKGDMDEILIYGRALSEQEIKKLAQN